MCGDNKLFWKRKKLFEMSVSEWESICSGCGHCCLHKLEDEESGLIYETFVACRLFDIDTCKCKHYERRHSIISECLNISNDIKEMKIISKMCSYRIFVETGELPKWHHLVTGDRKTVHHMGISIREVAVSENDVDMGNLYDYLFDA